jgi:hypothetical protein
MLPVFGVLRCPGRMMIALDLALAVLAAISVHLLMASSGPSDRLALLAKSVRRGATIWLPLVMMAVLGVVAAAGAWLISLWPDEVPFFVGGARQMRDAARAGNPAVWVPVALVIATGLSVRFWLARPGRRAIVLTGILLVDLFFITRFVDIPADGLAGPALEVPKAAEWLRRNAPKTEEYRIWGLSESYCRRPDELLLPKTCEPLGFSTIASYGPFQSPAHAQLFGFRIFGTNRDWARLIRRNCLLSLYGVQYILAGEDEFRHVIEAVRIPDGPPPADGPNLLTGTWYLTRAKVSDGVITFGTPFLWSLSAASHSVKLQPGAVYRIALDARGPDGGAANFLEAEIEVGPQPRGYPRYERAGLTVYPEQIGPEWRHFERTLEAPGKIEKELFFGIYTASERPIEVRNVSLRQSCWDQPVNLGGLLKAGQAVYRKVADLPPRRSTDPPVAIYQNMLYPGRAGSSRIADSQAMERLKWHAGEETGQVAEVPKLAIE